MLNILSGRKKKVEKFFSYTDIVPLAAFGATKDLYPEEALWLFNPDRGFKFYTKITMLYLVLLHGKIPTKTTDLIAKRFDQENAGYSPYFEQLHRYISSIEPVEGREESNEERLEKIAIRVGLFICFYVEKEYKANGEEYKFSPQFSYTLGNIILELMTKDLMPKLL